MYLVYVDESGNTGGNLLDPQQPVHFLAAVFVSEEMWQTGYGQWRAVVRPVAERSCAAARLALPGELHAVHVYHGSGAFRGVPREERQRIITAVLRMLPEYRLDVVYSACSKGRLQREGMRLQLWPERAVASGAGGQISEQQPGAFAWFNLLWACQLHLQQMAPQGRALLIADRSVLAPFVRRAIRAHGFTFAPQGTGLPVGAGLPFVVEMAAGVDAFTNLLDTVHFVDSHESPYIQLADFVAYFIMRAWRAGSWEQPGSEPHYDEFIRPSVRQCFLYFPSKQNDG
jgi:hypothetical protein